MSDNEKAKNLASELAWKHTPDSIKKECEAELRDMGYSQEEIRAMVNAEEKP